MARFPLSVTLLALAAACGVASAAADVKLTQTDAKIAVEVGGKPFTEYHFAKEAGLPWARPYFFPVQASDGVEITSDQARSNSKEHPHHRSLWVAQGNVSGVNQWMNSDAGKPQPEQHHVKFDKVEGDTIVEELSWNTGDGTPQLKELRTWRFFVYPDGNRGIDLTSVYTPASAPVTFGDTKEAGLIAVRLNKAISDTSVITLSTGAVSVKEPNKAKKDPGDEDKVWGKKADWCDLSGKIEGKDYGACVFDHPGNARHPSNWHVRRYGLLAANIFGLHDFDPKNTPKDAGDLTIEAGKSITFKYRVVIHTGNAAVAKLKEKYAEYAAGDKK